MPRICNDTESSIPAGPDGHEHGDEAPAVISARTTLPGTELLSSEVYPPKLGHPAIPSERLLNRLRALGDRKLCSLVAPPGFGKTTLLAQWYSELLAQGRCVAWIGLDGADADLGHFFRVLVQAIQGPLPAFDPLQHRSRTGSGYAHVTTLASAAIAEFKRLDQPIHILVDDAHRLADEQAIQLVDALLLGSPPWVQFVLAARSAPLVQMERLRMAGHAVEIDWNELRWTDDEAHAFLNSVGSQNLTAANARDINLRVEGWPAGLRFATLANDLLDSTQAWDSQHAPGHRVRAGFLAKNVLNSLPAPLRRFLLKTSVLRSICVSLCDEINPGANNGELLAEVSSRGLFLYSIGEGDEWHRYHRMFAGFLEDLLHAEDPEAPCRLRQAAARWCASHGLHSEAVTYAFASGDLQFAAALMDAHQDALWRFGPQQPFIRWLRQLPDGLRARYPRLSVKLAFGLLLEWKIDRCRRLIDEVRRVAQDVGDDELSRGTALRDALFLEIMLTAFCDDPRSFAELERRWTRVVVDADAYEGGGLGNVGEYCRGRMYIFAETGAWAVKMRNYFDELDSPHTKIWGEHIVGCSHQARGHTNIALNHLRSSMEYSARTVGEDSPTTAMSAVIAASIEYQRDNVEVARQLLRVYFEAAVTGGLPDPVAAAYVVAIRIAALDGRWAEVQRLLSEGYDTAVARGLRRLNFDLLATQLWLKDRGFPVSQPLACDEAFDTTASSEEFSPSNVATFVDEALAKFAIRQALASGKNDKAIAIAQKWRAFLGRRNAQWSLVEMSALHAAALLKAGETKRAERVLLEVLPTVLNTKVIHVFLDEGHALAALLGQTCLKSRALFEKYEDYLSWLLPVLQSEGLVTAQLGSVEEVEGRALNALSEQECRILSLVGAGDQNGEIADKLGLTLNTVKWYMRQILSKTGTTHRIAAFRVAKAHGLLPRGAAN